MPISASKPAGIYANGPRWASDDGTADIAEPLSGEKDLGWADAEEPPAPYMNWLQRNVYEWQQYLEDATDQLNSTKLETSGGTVTGDLTVGDDLTVTDFLSVGGSALINGALLQVTNQLIVNGDTQLNGEVTVSDGVVKVSETAPLGKFSVAAAVLASGTVECDTTPQVYDGAYNIASIARNGAGDYTITFDDAVWDAAGGSGLTGLAASTLVPAFILVARSSSPLIVGWNYDPADGTKLQVFITDNAGVAQDSVAVSVLVVGNADL
jgi:hypothetical protein